MIVYYGLCRQESGTATVLVPGGALEALNSDSDKIRLVLNRRKGFIKLALRFGVDLVPTFSFGEAFIYDQVKPHNGKKNATNPCKSCKKTMSLSFLHVSVGSKK
jgi:hypothetical protein